MIESSGRLGRARFLRLGWFAPAVAGSPTPQPGYPTSNTIVKLSLAGTLTAISSYIHMAELSRTVGTKDTTGILSSAVHRTAGDQIDSAFKFDGYFDPTFQTIATSNINQAATFEYYPAGTAYPKHAGTAILTKAEIKTPANGATTLQGELKTSGPITRS